MSKADVRWYGARKGHWQASARAQHRRWVAISEVSTLVSKLEYACSDLRALGIEVPSRHNLPSTITHKHDGRFYLKGMTDGVS